MVTKFLDLLPAIHISVLKGFKIATNITKTPVILGHNTYKNHPSDPLLVAVQFITVHSPRIVTRDINQKIQVLIW